MNTDTPADQYECTARLLSITPDAAIVSNLGVASYVLAGVEDRARNFYQWGSMGSTTPIGLGLALALDDPVTVLDGDGSMVMSLGALATVADQNPPNLTVVVWDNGQYGTTGGQPSASRTVDFAAVARDVGLAATHVSTTDDFEAAYADAVASDEATVVVCDVEPVDPDERPPFDFAHIKWRFRDAVAPSE
ncbi:thiamine pyrophosphate-dependent enzyme [Salinirubellus salinus]|uniref:sulfopyruvate decarboxylase n=1 Tax=Salinirubellus salinus TaxID=1364945 RepID=A0A9E7UB48_9EURY|nr:thiamine pyrophosphate-dependent enzyme [Salinirubellus salinus]UWM54469.1 thiamine pyrophosphate-dependent enzyme [Salinirubellus salinus]